MSWWHAVVLCAGIMGVYSSSVGTSSLGTTVSYGGLPQSRLLTVTQSNLAAELVAFMDSSLETSFNYSVICLHADLRYTLTLTTADSKTLQIQKPMSLNISCQNATRVRYGIHDNRALNVSTATPTSLAVSGQIDVTLKTGVLGFGVLEFKLMRTGEGSSGNMTVNSGSQDSVTEYVASETVTYDVKVLRKMRPIDIIFRVLVYCVQVLVTMGFGVKLDLQVVKDNLKKPIAPGIGFCCQYVIMPLIAYAVARLVTDGSSPVSLGIFVAGCCPGGGASNMYSYLLKGDLSLSITMTTISTVAAMAMLPLWVYTLGSTIYSGQNVTIPFQNVAISLSIIIVPLVVGVLLRQKCPKVAKTIQKALKPVIIFFSVILITAGIYSNLFVFRLFKPKIVLAACLLPYVGYIMGGIVSAVFRQPWTKIKTIILETGMQNTSIAYILLVTSFSSPLGDIAGVAPVASAVMTPLPPFLVTVTYLIYQRCRRKYSPANTADEEKEKYPDGEMDGVTEKLTAV